MVDAPVRASLLLVEDDRELGPLLVEVLGDVYDVTLARDGQAGLHRALTSEPDVLVVDRGLPGIEGLDLVARLRRSGVRAPVLVLTARGTVQDRVDGLDAGAEDYLVKPFDVAELLARLRALLRRHTDTSDVLDVAGASFDVRNRHVTRDHGVVDLTAREADLLEVLARHPRRVFTREELIQLVFGGDVEPNTVDSYVHYLRDKLGRTTIQTVHGLGYRLGPA
ncbi:MAG: response regulator transcription factor [Cellulomonas sp.]|nr:response regulator transcription factor [Cellulomonas sp.]MBO9555049.1 response regulator transcription factor [Cellulomonas sp.]